MEKASCSDNLVLISYALACFFQKMVQSTFFLETVKLRECKQSLHFYMHMFFLQFGVTFGVVIFSGLDALIVDACFSFLLKEKDHFP